MTTFTTNFSSNRNGTTPVSYHNPNDVTIEVTTELFKQLPSKPSTYLRGKNSVVFSATGSNAILPYARTINRGCVRPHAAGKRFPADKFELIEHKQGTNFGVLSLSATLESHDVDGLVAFPTFDDKELLINGHTMSFFKEGTKKLDHITHGLVSAVNIGQDPQGNALAHLLFETVDGRMSSIVLPYAKIADDLANQARQQGIVVVNEYLLCEFLNAQLVLLMMAKAKDNRLGFTAVDKLGWHRMPTGQFAYNFGTHIVAKADAASQLISTTTNPPQLRQKGSLADWQQHIGIHLTGNDFAIGMLCMGLMPMLFKFMPAIMPVTVHLCGDTKHGKSLLSHVISSMFSNGGKAMTDDDIEPYLRDLYATRAGLEAHLQMLDGLPACFDELGMYDASNDPCQLIYSVSASTGKLTARSDSMAQARKLRRTLLLLLGEISMRNSVLDSESCQGGVLNRLFELTIAKPIFPQGESTQWCQQLLSDCSIYYGTVADGFIRSLIEADVCHQMVNARFIQAYQRIEQDHPELAGLPTKEDRILSVIALAEVAGQWAVEQQILPFDSMAITNAIDELVRRLIQQAHDAVGRVVEYIEHALQDTILSTVVRKDSKSAVFLYTSRGDGCNDYLALDADKFDEYFGDKLSLQLRQDLRAKGRLKNTCSGRDDYRIGKCALKVYLLRYDTFLRSVYHNDAIVDYFDREARCTTISLQDEFGNDD